MSVLSIMDRTFNLSVRCLSVRWGVIRCNKWARLKKFHILSNCRINPLLSPSKYFQNILCDQYSSDLGCDMCINTKKKINVYFNDPHCGMINLGILLLLLTKTTFLDSTFLPVNYKYASISLADGNNCKKIVGTFCQYCTSCINNT